MQYTLGMVTTDPEYAKKYYAKNKDKMQAQINASRRARRLDLRSKVDELKRAPCTDCGDTFIPFVMEYDHVPGRGAKAFEIGDAVRDTRPWNRILEEIEKCDLVCSNCHGIRTWNRYHPPVAQLGSASGF